jgi:hypothetical protein
MPSESDPAWKIGGARKLNSLALRNAAEILDEVLRRIGAVSNQGGPQEPPMCFLNRDTLRRRASAKLFHNDRLKATDEELGHELKVISMIASVKEGRKSRY